MPPTTAAATASQSAVRRTEALVIALCFAVIAFDGYDLIVYGASLPALLTYQPWGLTPATAGAIGSAALVGMIIGALAAGTATDLLGRRRILLIGITWFSLAMIACAVAPNAGTFGFFRLLGGIGLGGVMPTAIALTAEYSRPERRSLNNALMFSGYSVGGVFAAVSALVILPNFGFRPMYALGALPLLLLPIFIKWLPESLAYLVSTGRTERAEQQAARLGLIVPEPVQSSTGKRSLSALLTSRYLGVVILFAITSFFGLLLVYGLNTWLPQIMKSAGYPLTSSLLFLVIMNVGAVVGAVAVAPLGDRFGMKPVTLAAFGVACVSIFALSLAQAEPVLYALVAVAGFGTVGTQILVNAYVAMHFPTEVRATALGFTLGIGRLGAVVGPIFGGLLMAAGVPAAWNFYAFAIPAALGLIMVALLPRTKGTHASESSTA